jgi:hypothetical protein
MKCMAWNLQGTIRHNTHAAFVPLMPETIVDLGRVLRNYSEWEKDPRDYKG